MKPGGRLSYQYRQFRSKVWFVVEGTAVVTLDNESKSYEIGNVILLPKGVKHRVANESNIPLCFIEVQSGSYFGEDDIVSVTDDYGRI